MRKLLTIAKRLTNLRQIFEEETRREAARHQKLIAKLNVDQLKSGTRADGSDMPNYSPNSKSRHAPAKIKLWDTGDFHAGLEPLFSDEGFDVVGLDQKTNLLVDIYGKQILGLTKESTEILKRAMLPRLTQQIKKRILS